MWLFTPVDQSCNALAGRMDYQQYQLVPMVPKVYSTPVPTKGMESEQQIGRESCYICGHENSDILESHHIIPDRYDGVDSDYNRVELCPTCHEALEKLYDEQYYYEIGLRDEEPVTVGVGTHEKVQFKTYVYDDMAEIVREDSRSNTDIVNQALMLYYHVQEQHDN